MSVHKDMAARLLEQERMHAGGEPNERLREVRKMIEKQKAQLRQMKWVVIGLWITSVVGLFISLRLAGANELLGSNDRPVRTSDAQLAIALVVRISAQFLPLAAIVSTVVYFVRKAFWTGRADRREIAARLENIEQALEQIAEK